MIRKRKIYNGYSFHSFINKDEFNELVKVLHYCDRKSKD